LNPHRLRLGDDTDLSAEVTAIGSNRAQCFGYRRVNRRLVSETRSEDNSKSTP
jgi:hypothetical protein